MIELAVEPPTTYREQIALLWNQKGLLRLLGYLAVVYFLTPIVLGLIFLAMLFPLTLALVRLTFVFTPVYHLAGRIMCVKGLPERLAKSPMWFLVYSIVWVVVMLAVVGFLVRMLFFSGFCNQNLICMLVK